MKFQKVQNGYRFKVILDFTNQDNGYKAHNPISHTKEEVEKLISSPETKRWLEIKNALIMWGHGARDLENRDFLPKEHNPRTGLEQEPVGVIESIEMHSDTEVEITALLADTKKAHTAMKLVEAGIAKFSMVWNFDLGILFGMDLSFIPSFSSNRAIELTCDGDKCFLESLEGVAGVKPDEYEVLEPTTSKVIKEISMLKNMIDIKNDRINELEEEILNKSTHLENLNALFTPTTPNPKVIEPTYNPHKTESTLAKKVYLFD